MITKEKVRQLLEIISEAGMGQVKFGFVSIAEFRTPKDCYNAYYSGPGEIGFYYSEAKRGMCYQNYSSPRHAELITDKNRDFFIDEVYNAVHGNVQSLIGEALKNVYGDGEFEYLKYFDRKEEAENYKKFIAELERLLEEKQNAVTVPLE